MEAKEFVRQIREYNPNADAKKLTKAFSFAREAHSGQKRVTGEDFFEHPLAVSKILMKLRVGSDTISAALLHDVVEETKYSLKDIRKEFGKEIASIVEGLTNLDKIQFDSQEDYKAENIRKILLASTKDIRIILIKLADRLHNMKTLESFKPEKQKRIARETLDIYAPIAQKLGMWWVKGELEDLSLRVLEPEVYMYLKKKINEKRAERERTTEKIMETIENNLSSRSIKAKVTGRAKYFYSIYQKMLKKNLNIEDIYDLIAIRIITKNIPDCYAALGTVHELWTPIPRRFKDYIANPKSNGYQSLHTVLKGPKDTLIEVQIRTEEEHFFAEDGIAAHWRYKGTERDKRFDKKISWLKQLLAWRRDSKKATDFIETLKLDLFENEIVVFTPKGDPISLPEGASPVDFAYEVHTSIGEHCSKAIVNDKMVPLNYSLKAGDVVEIITQKDAKPSRQWLNFVVTNKAKSKIRSKLSLSLEQETKQKDTGMGIKEMTDMIKVEGKQSPVKLSRCCMPKPGDKIVAYHTKDKKITVHKADCLNINKLSDSKAIKVSWRDDIKKKESLRVTLKDREGILSQIMNEVVNYDLHLSNINTREGKEKQFNLFLEIEEPDMRQLKKLMSHLRGLDDVINVTHVKS